MNENTNAPEMSNAPGRAEIDKVLRGYQLRQAAWRELRIMALERFRDSVKDPRGVKCPEILATGRRLAEAEPGTLEPAFDAFKDALLARIRGPIESKESKAIAHLTEHCCGLFQALAEATKKELEAGHAIALLKAQEQQTHEKPQGGGIH